MTSERLVTLIKGLVVLDSDELLHSMWLHHMLETRFE